MYQQLGVYVCHQVLPSGISPALNQTRSSSMRTGNLKATLNPLLLGN
jgi:hypothetical protein